MTSYFESKIFFLPEGNPYYLHSEGTSQPLCFPACLPAERFLCIHALWVNFTSLLLKRLKHNWKYNKLKETNIQTYWGMCLGKTNSIFEFSLNFGSRTCKGILSSIIKTKTSQKSPTFNSMKCKQLTSKKKMYGVILQTLIQYRNGPMSDFWDILCLFQETNLIYSLKKKKIRPKSVI